MKKILYNKINKQISRVQWFTDQDGNYWVNTDPYGVQMSGKVTIICLTKDHPQYEIREVEI